MVVLRYWAPFENKLIYELLGDMIKCDVDLSVMALIAQTFSH
jgi:hypothetical protein